VGGVVHRLKLFGPLCAVAIFACTAQQQPAVVADTTLDRGDTTAVRRAAAADTQDGASPADTMTRRRSLGMQRSDGRAPQGARRDSVPQPQD
jgi:hypothetical protein